MTLKKQFTLLITFIIAIPVICIIFLLIQNYLHSSKRYLIEGFREVNGIESIGDDNKNSEYADALHIVSLIPPTVQSCLVSPETSKIIFTNMEEMNSVKTMEDLLAILKNSSKNYFYQFTSPNTKKETLLITRIPRKRPAPSAFEKIISTVLIVLIVGIAISIIVIFNILRTIFNSIIDIKNETKEIANGNLNDEITSPAALKNQNEIMSILESLEKMRQKLCEVENRKNNFIMGISHDLRTPVAIIKGYSEALSDGIITNENDKKSALNLIQAKTELLEEMINDLISFTKLNNFEIREKLTIQSITDLIKTFAKEAKLSSLVFKREVICNIDLPENILIPLNKNLINRVFTNLLSNALRYTNDEDRIEINSYRDGKFILFEIIDSGIGINKKDLPHIFDLFYKSSGSRRGNSMGIGLAVVKTVLDAHGWSITVKSKKDVGTNFKIQIPVIEI